MEFSREVADKFENASTLVDKVRVLLEDAHSPEVVYNKLPGEVQTIDDIAMIQCFHGTDIARIRATTTALEFNLQMTRRPSTWVFVECQKSKEDCAFSWLRRYGIDHHFVQMKDENEGIFLKTPLWNIGTTLCKESRLCFVDSDVVLCNSDWVERASNEFSTHDVLSLASHQYYEEDDECQLKKTIGYQWQTYHTIEHGHCGFTLGMTRDAFNELGGFDATLILDDLHTYHSICGDKVFEPYKEWVVTQGWSSGHSLELGYVDNVACHVWHGADNGKYDSIRRLLKCSIDSYSTIIDYDKGNFNRLPRWVDSKLSQGLKETLSEYNEKAKDIEFNPQDYDLVDSFGKKMQTICGDIGDRPLFVCSVVKDGFGLKLSDMVEWRNTLESRFSEKGHSPVVVFFTNNTKFDFKSHELNVVPLKDYDRENEFKQALRTDLQFPEDAIVYYIPFGQKDFNTNLWMDDLDQGVKVDGTMVFSVKKPKKKA